MRVQQLIEDDLNKRSAKSRKQIHISRTAILVHGAQRPKRTNVPLHLLDIRQWQHHRQVHRKVDQQAHFARPTGATSKLKVRAHSYELLII